MTEDMAWLGSWLAAESMNGRANVNTMQGSDQLDRQSQTRPDIVGQLPTSSGINKRLDLHTTSAPTDYQSSSTSGSFASDQLLGQTPLYLRASPPASSLSGQTQDPIRPRPHSHSIASSSSITSTARFGLPSIETSMHISRSASLDTAISIPFKEGLSSSDETSPNNSHSNSNSSFFSSWRKPSASGTPDFSNTRTRSSSSSQDFQQPVQYQRPEGAHDRPSSHRMSMANAKIDPNTLQRRRTMARQLLGPSSSTQVRSGDYIGPQDTSGERSISSSASSPQLNTSRDSPNSERSSWIGTRYPQEIVASSSLMASSLPSEKLYKTSGVQQQTVFSEGRRTVSRSLSGPEPADANKWSPSGGGRNPVGEYSSFFEEGETCRRVIIDGRLFEFEKDGRSLKIVENETREVGIVYSSSESREFPLSSPLSLNMHIRPPTNQALSPLLPASASSFYGDIYSIRGSIASSISEDVLDVASPAIDSEQSSLGMDRLIGRKVAHKGNITEEAYKPVGKEGKVLVVEDSFGSLSSTGAPGGEPSPRGPNQARVVDRSQESLREHNPSTPQKVQIESITAASSDNLENPPDPLSSPHSTVSSNLPTPPMLEDSTLHETKGYSSLISPDQPSPSPSPLTARPHHQSTSSTSSSKSWSSKQLPSKLMIPSAGALSPQPASHSTKRTGGEGVSAGCDPATHYEKGRERGSVVEEEYDSGEDNESHIFETQPQQLHHHLSLQQQQSPQHQYEHQQQYQRLKLKNLPSPPLTSPLITSSHQSNEEPKHASNHTRSESAPADPYEVLSRPMPKEYNTQDIWKKGVKKLGVIGALGKAATRKGIRNDRPHPVGGLRNLTPTTPIYPKPSPGHSQFASTNKGGHELSSVGVTSVNDSSALSPHAVHMDHLRRIHQEPLREAVSPTVHTGGQIAARANAIENEEERKLAENMFM